MVGKKKRFLCIRFIFLTDGLRWHLQCLHSPSEWLCSLVCLNSELIILYSLFTEYDVHCSNWILSLGHTIIEVGFCIMNDVRFQSVSLLRYILKLDYAMSSGSFASMSNICHSIFKYINLTSFIIILYCIVFLKLLKKIINLYYSFSTLYTRQIL